MGLFQKKSRQGEVPNEKIGTLDIQTIPDIFYGGKDPNIYEPTAAAAVQHPLMSEPPKKIAPLGAAVPIREQESSIPPASKEKKKSHLVLIIALLSIIVLAAVSWYYISDALQSTRVNNQSAQVPPPIVASSTQQQPSIIVPLEQDAPRSTSSSTVTPVLLPSNRIVFPRTTFSVSVDIDSDDLTDQEEEVFGTDSGAWDSDDDGYYDGQELSNLYNPGGFAPLRLIDSGLVREYINPAFQYRLYYPLGWDVSSVDPQSTQVLVSAITGDYIAVHTIVLPPETDFVRWFSTNASQQQFSDLQQKQSRFGIDYFVRRDGLVAYVQSDNYLYVIVYTPGVSEQIFYPNIMNMLIQSFRPNRAVGILPEQVILPSSTPIQNTDTSTSSSPSGLQQGDGELSE